MTATIRWCTSAHRFRVTVESGVGAGRYQILDAKVGSDREAIAAARLQGVPLRSIHVAPAEP